MNVQVLHGDCLDALADLEPVSVDSIVTDPPYGLAFMGKGWDHAVPGPDYWTACLRVLKPGGHLLAFGGTRTAHRLASAVEDAGFEIRDTITWHYGSGFPKSLDVSKAIDKAAGDPLSFRRFARAYADAVAGSPMTHTDVDRHLGIKSSSCYWAREDHRGGLPPRHHWERVRDLLGLDGALGRLYDEAEREVIGERTTGRGAGKGAVAYIGDSDNRDVTAPATDAARQWSGWGTALKPASEPIIVARKPLGGTVAANVLAHGTGALNIDATRVQVSDADREFIHKTARPNSAGQAHTGDVMNRPAAPTVNVHAAGRWPSNVVLSHAPDCGPDEVPGPCVDGCPVAELDAQSGYSKSPPVGSTCKSKPHRSGSMGGGIMRNAEPMANGHGDSGGASRFFPTFRYQAKAPTSERPKIDGVAHPTVKPLALMRWLVRLVTPPGGLVLDPFAGSGTTLQAARDEGFAAVGIEREATYLPLIAHRLERVPA